MQQAVLRVSAILLLVVAVAATAAYLLEGDDGPSGGTGPATGRPFADALLQDEEHDHRNASEHQLYTDNIEYVDFCSKTGS